MALDLPHQPARGPGGRAGHDALHAQPQARRRRPLRPGRLCHAGAGHDRHLAGAGRTGRSGLGQHAGGAADGGRTGSADGLLAARHAPPRPAVSAGALYRAQLPRGHPGQPVRTHRLGRHALPAAAAAAAGHGILASRGRHDAAASDAGQHRRQARRLRHREPLRLPAGAAGQHRAAGRADRRLRPDDARPAAVAAHHPAGFLRRRQLHPVLGHEHRDAEGSGRRPRRQRQQPVLDGADAGPEPGHHLRLGTAARLQRLAGHRHRRQ